MDKMEAAWDGLAKAFYDRDPILEQEGEERWFVPWEDIKDSYPATYEECMGKAVAHMYA